MGNYIQLAPAIFTFIHDDGGKEYILSSNLYKSLKDALDDFRLNHKDFAGITWPATPNERGFYTYKDGLNG